MTNGEKMVELKQLLGSLVFAAARPLGVSEMRRCLAEVGQTAGGEASAFAGLKEADIRTALNELAAEMNEKCRVGFHLAEVAGGFRFQTDPNCGKWIKHLLELGRPNRMSRPSLETLAIIAYRQPIMKSEIEGVRGVNVDHIIKGLLELRLIRIAGRSKLPGHPFLYGTTQLFLEHFGLKDLKDLKDIEPMLLASREIGGRLTLKQGEQKPEQVAAGQAAGPEAVQAEGKTTGEEGEQTGELNEAKEDGMKKEFDDEKDADLTDDDEKDDEFDEEEDEEEDDEDEDADEKEDEN
jgi:segregation and condensation protein B